MKSDYLNRARIIQLWCLFWLAGIVLGTILHLSETNRLWLLYAAVASVVVAVFFRSCRPVATGVLLCILGTVFVSVYASYVTRDPVPVTDIGTVRSVERSEKNQRLLVHFFDQNIFIYATLYPEYTVGEVVYIDCFPSAPEPFQGFNFDAYAASRNVQGVCYYPKVNSIGSRESYITRMQGIYSNLFSRYFHEPESAFLRSITLRQTRDLPTEIRDAFSHSGLSHVLAISGLHIGILLLICNEMLILLRLVPWARMGIIAIVIYLYISIIGFPASAVRAGLMGFAFFWAYTAHRHIRPLYILISVAALLTLFNPLYVVYDIGYQLSFLALLGIVTMYSRFERLLHWISDKGKARSIVSVSIASQWFTWPIIAFHFSILSLISPLANLIGMPLFLFVYVYAFLSPIASLLPLGNVVVYPLHIGTQRLFEVVNFFSSIPGAYIAVDLSVQTTVAIYVLIFLVTLTFYIYESRHSDL